MHLSLSSGIAIGVLSLAMVSAQNASEPFRVDWPPSTGECELLKFVISGGLMPYSMYFAASHANDNRTWSEENFIANGNIHSFQLFLTPGIGKYTDALRFRIFDSAGAEDMGWVEVIAPSSEDCSVIDSSMITIEQPSSQESPPSITTKNSIALVGNPSLSPTETIEEAPPSTTRGSPNPTSASPRPGNTPENPAQQTQTDLNPQSSPNPNGQTTGGWTGGGGDGEGPSPVETALQTGEGDPISATNEGSGSQNANPLAPNTPVDFSGALPSENKSVYLSKQAAGVIGATIGTALVVGTAFAWYKYRGSISSTSNKQPRPS
ncbi:hypothetical protein CPB86DRAFT_811316 [Serendipita vermifera]|nr:hypothetical protein CPB86DRAFT_811316 [Serendipita vermifera]